MNECDVNNGGCSHLCNNAVGSFNCYCHEGFELQNDTFTCQGKSDYKNDYICRIVYCIRRNFQGENFHWLNFRWVKFSLFKPPTKISTHIKLSPCNNNNG